MALSQYVVREAKSWRTQLLKGLSLSGAELDLVTIQVLDQLVS